MNRHLTSATVSVWIEINFAPKALDFVHNYFIEVDLLRSLLYKIM